MSEYEHDPLAERWSSVGPFNEYRVVVNGWQVPLIQAHELDGGQVHIMLDHRLGLTLSVDEADRVIPFIADVIAVAWGYNSHPMADEWYAEHGFDNPFEDRSAFSHVPHPSLGPHRIREITGVQSEDDSDA